MPYMLSRHHASYLLPGRLLEAPSIDAVVSESSDDMVAAAAMVSNERLGESWRGIGAAAVILYLRGVD